MISPRQILSLSSHPLSLAKGCFPLTSHFSCAKLVLEGWIISSLVTEEIASLLQVWGDSLPILLTYQCRAKDPQESTKPLRIDSNSNSLKSVFAKPGMQCSGDSQSQKWIEPLYLADLELNLALWEELSLTKTN